MRLLNIFVIGALIMAASFVYKIKFDSTLQAERVGKLASELRRERNAIATLRAEWAKLDTPGRIQGLASRHLAVLRPIVPTQFDSLDRLPDRPRGPAALTGDPIATMMAPTASNNTGSVTPPGAR
jgi:cell division protein FtsL